MTASNKRSNRTSKKIPKKMKSSIEEELVNHRPERSEATTSTLEYRPPINNQSQNNLLDDALRHISFRDGSIEGQASLLTNPKIAAVQRQTLATRIGTVHGNRHMQQVMTSIMQQPSIATRDDAGGLPAYASETTLRTSSLAVQRQPRNEKKELDQNALTIINAAQDPKVPIEKRAVQAVKDIIKQYFPSQAELVERVVYDASEPGLLTTAATSKNAKGIITVGSYFVENTNKKYFARRVLQVDHELEHVRQQRLGLGGPQRQHLREFLAFYREALATELPGTGRISHSTRVTLIDEALKHYYRLSQELKTKYSENRDRLLKARQEHAEKSGRDYPAPPGPRP